MVFFPSPCILAAFGEARNRLIVFSGVGSKDVLRSLVCLKGCSSSEFAAVAVPTAGGLVPSSLAEVTRCASQ